MNCKRILYFIALLLIHIACFTLYAQEKSAYNYVEAFGPNFYTYNGNDYRSASGKPGPAYWQNRSNYNIKVVLDEAKQRVYGTVELLYTNNSPENLDFIWFQLDQNLFKSDSRGQSTIPLNNSRYGSSSNSFEGGFILSNIEVNKAPATNYHITDTRMRINLPNPVQSRGGQVKIAMDFEFIMPTYGADRTGVLTTKYGYIYSIAQWYPRVCVFDDVLGWNTQPYTGPGEFYLEYGDFNVEITAPANHIVVFGGELLNPSEVWSSKQLERYNQAKSSNKTVLIRTAEEVEKEHSTQNQKGTKTWKYTLKNARDVAWASSQAFIIDGAKIDLGSGKTALALSAYPRESNGGNAWKRSTEYTKASIEHYSKMWYEYPYPVAVNVASNVGGMEYPAISFCGSKAKAANLWGVTDHEFGHNWFPMIVGSNERLHAWMDEGFNTFINDISTQAFNKGEYSYKYGKPNSLTLALFDPSLEPVMCSPQNMKEKNIGYLVYYKPAYALHLLRNEIIGKDRFDHAFRKYIANWAYKHPIPNDFFRTIENETGENLNWFWRGMFQNNWQMDQAISDVRYVERNPSKGVIITIQNNGKLPMPVELEIRFETGNKKTVKLPVEIWERNKSWTFKVNTTEAIKEVRLDPRDVFPDVNPENNSWKVK